MPFVVISLSFFIVVILYYAQYCKRWRRKYGQLAAIPGPRTYPLLGNMWRITLVPRLERIERQATMLKEYGKLFKMWVADEPVIICSNVEDAEIILNSRVNVEKSFFYDYMKPWLGTGVLISTGSKWRQIRKWHKQIIDFSMLDCNLPRVVEHGRTFIEKMHSMEGREDEWDVFPFVQNYALDVVCDIFLGVYMDVQNSGAQAFFNNLRELTTIITEKAITPWWHIEWLYTRSRLYEKEMKSLQVLHDISMDIIQRKRQLRWEQGNLDSTNYAKQNMIKTYLDLLLDVNDHANGTHLTDEDIRVEVDNFLFGGQDSTSSGISSIIHFLSCHPDIQDKVAAELFSVFGDSDRDPTLEDISNLKYLECVIKESHRLLPPVPHISRTLSEEVTLGGKYRIPAGTAVQVNMFAIHRQEEHFANPPEFNPDNFTPEKCRRRHPFAFLPFSAGPRNCIGQKFAMLETKLLLALLLRKYEIESSQSTRDLGLYVALTIRHAHGVRVRIRPRRKT